MARLVLAVGFFLTSAGLAPAAYRIRTVHDLSIGGLPYSVFHDGEPFLLPRSLEELPTEFLKGLEISSIGASAPELGVGGGGRRLTVLADGASPRFGVVSGGKKGTGWTFEILREKKVRLEHPQLFEESPRTAPSERVAIVRVASGPFKGMYLGLDPRPLRKVHNGKTHAFYRFRLVKDRAQAARIVEHWQHTIERGGVDMPEPRGPLKITPID
jgi:hypothetical protein